MAAPTCPAALDALVLTDGVACAALYDRATMNVIHYAGDADGEQVLDGAFHVGERLSVDDPNVRVVHAQWAVYVRASGRASVVVQVKPGSKAAKSISRTLQRVLKRAEADLGPMRPASESSALVLVDGRG